MKFNVNFAIKSTFQSSRIRAHLASHWGYFLGIQADQMQTTLINLHTLFNILYRMFFCYTQFPSELF